MLTMLVPLLAALMATSPQPSGAVSPPPSPLKEIGHVESLSVCSAIVVHANSAIGVALDNDRQLALVMNRLRTTDLDDGNAIKRRNGMNDLSVLASRIRIASVTGTGEIKRLRAMVATTTEPARKADLKAFADALSGAIVRQRSAARDLDRALTIIDGRQSVDDMNTEELVGQRSAIASDPAGRVAPLGSAGIMRNSAAPQMPVRANDVLRGIANDFAERLQGILGDEGTAADHSLGATTGC